MAVRLMSEEELVQFFENYQSLNISVDDLRKVRSQTIMQIFTGFLREFDFEVESIYQTSWDALQVFEYPELYEDCLVLVKFSLLINYLMQLCGITDFSIKDIIDPKPKRTRKILSHLVAYWNYAAKEFEKWVEVKEEYQCIARERDELLRQKDEIKQKINEQITYLQEHSDEFLQTEERIRSLQSEFDEKYRHRESVTQEYQQVKTMISDIEKTLGEKQVNIATLKEQKVELEGKIVGSPDQLVKEGEELRLKLEELRARKKELEDQKKSMMMCFETHKMMAERVDSALEFLNEFLGKIREYKQKIENLDAERVKRQDAEKKYEELHKKVEQLHLNLQVRKDQAAKQSMQHQKQMHSLQDLVQETYRELENLRQKSRSGNKPNAPFGDMKEKLFCQLRNIEEVKSKFSERVKKENESLLEKLDKYKETAMKEILVQQRELENILEDLKDTSEENNTSQTL
ncbi:kinetochore protein Nuf2-like [Limulus polyphemus]|uniref:Kinetochore protein Nuf2-like n=1 Tax=Limulus polyphemus TaxID=6850 RepID=A0ABM1THQ9_LIMPO|nr:kinetochore protein Nuf2-like [Limulus polyphemus]